MTNLIQQIDDVLLQGPYSFPGAYPLYFVTRDGSALSYEAVEERILEIKEAISNPGTDTQWEVVGIEINYEDAELYCDHTSKRIESAYSED